MDNYEKTAIVRSMSKGAETLTDEEVGYYLDLAESAVMDYLHPFKDLSGKEMPERYDFVQIRIAVYAINRRGAEGQSKHIEVGTERDFSSADIPIDLLKEITPMCGFPG